MSPWATSTRLTENQSAGGGMSVSRETFDYVIVGAGSAGCVLADRLTEDGRHRVLVLEYGGSDRSLWIQMPTALYIPMNMARYDWRYYTEPEPHLGGRRLHTPRGKVLGGSSSINGLVYVRGNPLDFEGWEREGAAGWGYGDVLPYFKRAERRAGGGDEYRGAEGPLATRRGRLENPLNAAWLEAGRQAGYALTADMNGFRQEGFGEMDMTVGGGRRCSAANAYLRPAMGRPNLSVRTHALATRVLFDGLGASNHFETGGFVRSRAGVRYPDIQFHFLPLAVSYDGSALAREHGFQAHVGPMRSRSAGWVRLRSAEPHDPPKICFNYMSQPADREEMRACVRITREIFAQPAFDRYRGREIQPGEGVGTDEQIDAFIREKAESAFHPCGTSRMGSATDPRAVVDPETRVIGLEALRVVDSSIMPSITTGNLNAPTIMLAEKAADHIRGRPLLPRSTAPYYTAPNWQSAQR